MPAKFPTAYHFVDLFAGCGGLSLGLLQAGWTGHFAIEHEANAFATLEANLISQTIGNGFHWPDWLPKKPTAVEDLLKNHNSQLEKLCGQVDLVAGGPPCQGFSSAGRRREDDPRNQLFAAYVEFVRIVRPRALLIENVRGFTSDFRPGEEDSNYAMKLNTLLSQDYDVFEKLLNLTEFGVPQSRTRYFMIAFRKEECAEKPFEKLRDQMPGFLRSLGLQVPVTAWSAISDLEVGRGGTQPSSETSGFEEINYAGPLTHYQKMMSKGTVGPTDLRLARHKTEIVERFQSFIEWSHKEGRLNTSVNDEIRQRLGTKKRAFRVLDPDRPSPTITSMPDDLLHYKEPRTLTVRENARLQSFPDWFSFKGKYTTGGLRRRQEIPRFTQVANAVPPLASRALGRLILEMLMHPQTDSSSKDRLQLAELIS